MTNDELTPEEREALEALRQDKEPSDVLETRTVAALHREGLLRPARRSHLELTPTRLSALVAACIALVAIGFGFGRWSAAPTLEPQVTVSGRVDATDAGRITTEMLGNDNAAATKSTSGRDTATNEVPTALDIQEKGSDYLLVLERYAALPPSERQDEAGREVALSSLYAAAGETVRLFPDNGVADRLLAVLEPEVEQGDRTKDETAKQVPQKNVIWF